VSASSTESPSIQVGSEHEVHTLDHVDQYLIVGKESDASDIHLGVNSKPIWRRFGQLEPIWLKAPVLTAADTEHLAMTFLTDPQKALLAERGDVDFAYANALGRFRTSVVRQRLGFDLTFRIINSSVRSMDELALPPQLKLLTQYHNGLVLVTGSVGSGKSTTLAALVQEINNSRNDHIITLEDPIEYQFEDNQSIIEQREVGLDTQSFQRGLKSVLRQDPDVIMVGEMRDSISIQAAISAADTGHLVLSTIHTTNAATSVGRILDFFPAEERDTVRRQLSSTLRAVICQRMVPTIEGKMTPAQEIMLNSPVIRKMIEENRLEKLSAAIETGRDDGMQSFNQALYDLVKANRITKEAALDKATNAQALEMMFQGIFLTTGSRILG